MVTLIDDAVGRVMRRLEALGLAENTVVVFTSDHGDWMGDHGVMLKGPMHDQGLIRAPLLWADTPSASSTVTSPGRGVDALASSLDLARSFLARAGLAAGNGMQGQDLAACMRPGGRSEHDCVIVEHQTSRPFPGFTRRIRVRTMTDGRWRMSLWEGVPFGELYDLESDPQELHNRWADPAFRTQRAELTERMLLKIIDLQDRAPFPVAEA
jgi:arylsulfatase A-like enzyme